MYPLLSATLLANNHIAELQRHTKSARVARAGQLEHRTVRIPRHWTNG